MSASQASVKHYKYQHINLQLSDRAMMLIDERIHQLANMTSRQEALSSLPEVSFDQEKPTKCNMNC
jgi:hypothetical protein